MLASADDWWLDISIRWMEFWNLVSIYLSRWIKIEWNMEGECDEYSEVEKAVGGFVENTRR